MATNIVERGIKVFNEWEVRALTLVSFSLQVILVAFGSKRKLTRSPWTSTLVWSAYMSADLVATLALGTLARKQHNNFLESFWAPFLLLHLGGPDPITAYAWEDNELWLRHFLGLVFQVGVAIYVFFRSLGDSSALFLMVIPVFLAGILKCGERTWVLWSTSSTQFRKISRRQLLMRTSIDDSENFQLKFFFTRLLVLFAGMKLHITEGLSFYSQMMDKIKQPKEAFQLVELELGLLYDVLYTKATIIYSAFGVLVRCFSILASISALLTFSIIIHLYGKAEHCNLNDIIITYFLLCGAVTLELYALAMVVASDWTKFWIVGKNKLSSNQVIEGKRWSRFIAGYNFMSFCLKQGATTSIWRSVQKLLPFIEEIIADENVTWHQRLDDELQHLIFGQLQGRIVKHQDKLLDAKLYKKLLNCRGDYVLKEMGILENLRWSTVMVEFDHSLILWHIATDLCYHEDAKNLCGIHSLKRYSEISRELSEYMLYLLIKCPNMLPKGNGDINYTEACQQAIGFFKSKQVVEVDKACQELLKLAENSVSTGSIDIAIDDESAPKSILYDACRLAAQLQKLKPSGSSENQNNWGRKEKWEMMNKVWVELLTYAAAHCDWKEHAQQLTSGGQLLSHVCVVMANLGLSLQYQHRLPMRLFDRSIPIL